MDNIQRIRDFFAAIKTNDEATIKSFFSHQSRFTNQPLGTVTGTEAIWEFLEPLHAKAESIEYRVHHIAESSEGFVLTERTDVYQLDSIRAEFPVMGIFQLDNHGTILEWRDYFDLKQCMGQLPM